jgi:soluble lytic murein transglycosylase-like protein
MKTLLQMQLMPTVDFSSGGNNGLSSTVDQSPGSLFDSLLQQLLSSPQDVPVMTSSGSVGGDSDPAGVPAELMALIQTLPPELPAVQPPAAEDAFPAHNGSNAGRPTEYEPLIAAAAAKYGVDPSLIKGIIQTESSFNPNAGSSAGAKGLMQLMDGTARGLGVTDSFDPAQNIEGGTRFLAYLLDKYKGNEKAALAAYNAGPGRVDRLGIRTDGDLISKLHQLPQETQRYVGKVLDAKNSFIQA